MVTAVIVCFLDSSLRAIAKQSSGTLRAGLLRRYRFSQ
jgi:hypothetical protein